MRLKERYANPAAKERLLGINDQGRAYFKVHTLDAFASMIGPPSMVQGIAETDMFRVFDNTTGDVVFWGKRYPLKAIVEEVQRLKPIAEAEAAKPHWPEG